jgi:DNA/RNA endonuclease YhcR with UshA esterase domain
MKRLNFLLLFRFFIFLLITILSFYSCTDAQVVTISEILSNPDKYHLKTVLVKGEVLDVKHKVSKKGNPYTVFALSDGTSAIKIFTFGTPEINRGDRVQVKGIFYKVKYVGRYTFYNEIDATDGWIKRE